MEIAPNDTTAVPVHSASIPPGMTTADHARCSAASGGPTRRDCEVASSRHGLQIGPHHIRDSADLAAAPELIGIAAPGLPIISERFERHVEADLVAELEAVHDRLGRAVDLDWHAFYDVLLNAHGPCLSRHAHDP